MIRKRGFQIFRFIADDLKADGVRIFDEHIVVSLGKSNPVQPVVHVAIVRTIGRFGIGFAPANGRNEESRELEEFSELVFADHIIFVEISGNDRGQLIVVGPPEHVCRLTQSYLPAEEERFLVHMGVHHLEIPAGSFTNHLEEPLSPERFRYRRIQESIIRDEAAVKNGEFRKNDEPSRNVEKLEK